MLIFQEKVIKTWVGLLTLLLGRNMNTIGIGMLVFIVW